MSKRQKENSRRRNLAVQKKTEKGHASHIEKLKKEIVEAEAKARNAKNVDGKSGWSAVATAQRKRLDTYIKGTAAAFRKNKSEKSNKSKRSQLKVNRKK